MKNTELSGSALLKWMQKNSFTQNKITIKQNNTTSEIRATSPTVQVAALKLNVKEKRKIAPEFWKDHVFLKK